jgi:hypothetical protein
LQKAKKAKAAKGARDVVIETRHHTEAQIAAKKAKAAKAGRSVEEREAHHTEAQASFSFFYKHFHSLGSSPFNCP